MHQAPVVTEGNKILQCCDRGAIWEVRLEQFNGIDARNSKSNHCAFLTKGKKERHLGRESSFNAKFGIDTQKIL